MKTWCWSAAGYHRLGYPPIWKIPLIEYVGFVQFEFQSGSPEIFILLIFRKHNIIVICSIQLKYVYEMSGNRMMRRICLITCDPTLFCVPTEAVTVLGPVDVLDVMVLVSCDCCCVPRSLVCLVWLPSRWAPFVPKSCNQFNS